MQSQIKKKKQKKSTLLILLLLLIIGCLCVYIFLFQKKQTISDGIEQADSGKQELAANQGAYVKPEEPVDRSKNVTLPGWGGFTIPANTAEITQGFEFHNPEENFWYVDHISVNG